MKRWRKGKRKKRVGGTGREREGERETDRERQRESMYVCNEFVSHHDTFIREVK